MNVMDVTGLRAFGGVFRYELVMQLRKRSVWLTYGVLAVLLGLVSGGQVVRVLDEPTSWHAMVLTGVLLTTLLPAAFGCLVADRLVRDRQLGVAAVLRAAPTGPVGWLLGKYLAVCAATGLPIVLLYLLVATAYAVGHGTLAAYGWALAVTGALLLPALLFVAAFALLCPLLMPATLFRVLFVGYWMWGNVMGPGVLPSLTRTVLCPNNGYVLQVVLGYDGEDHTGFAGPVPGAALNWLRPAPTGGAVVLSVLVLAALTAAALVAAGAVTSRTSR
jgi:ABC-2 type transport system permease protein